MLEESTFKLWSSNDMERKGGFRVPNILIDCQVCVAALVKHFLQFQIQRQCKWEKNPKFDIV